MDDMAERKGADMTEEYITRKAARDVLSALAIRHFELSDLFKIYIKALEDADADILKIPAADVAPVTGWIPVTERLPEPFTRVIGFMAWKAITAVEYQHNNWYSIDHLEPLPKEAVTHWMPLPNPPEVKE